MAVSGNVVCPPEDPAMSLILRTTRLGLLLAITSASSLSVGQEP